ncbi:hypothetical protein [Catenovulum sediminis]|uniref:Lipoprotein n=1 Tax=Catenovulum sediminis TaxID=1740262 RepID=A0ABV1RK48_9ALTE|nr:hypothetical protein [Catenovulum sediminis]
MNNFYKGFVILLSLTLIACGGGESSYKVDNGNGGDPVNPPPEPPVTEPPVESEVKQQKISSSTSELNVTQGAEFETTVIYQTAPEAKALAGVGIRLHWSSEYLSYIDSSQVYASGLLGVGDIERDTQDYDNDPTTDKFVVLSWADLPQGKWPSIAELPLNLANAKFSALKQGQTQVNFSASALASSYQFKADDIKIKVE